MSSSKTCRELFGHHQRGSAHDLPSRVDELVRRTRGELGEATSIIREHTILPFFLPLRPQKDADDAIRAMRGDRVASLKYRLGILTSRFRANHPLKACPRCMMEDRIKYHVAYWHLTHQYPGVWICPTHRLELLESAVKSTGVGRFQWYLPHESMLVVADRKHRGKPLPSSQRRYFADLADAAISLARLPADFRFHSDKLLQTYRAALCVGNLCSSAGKLKSREIGQEFLAFSAPFRILPEFATLPTTAAQASSQVMRLFYPLRTGTHPLRHLLTILWLFEDWSTFLEKYLRTDGDALRTLSLFQKRPTAPDATCIFRQRFQVLVSRERYSVTRAARALGIDPVTGMAWAAQAGIATKRRAKILKPNVMIKLSRDLRFGEDKDVVAKRYNVSLSCVSRVLRTEVGLNGKWRRARHARLRRAARQEYLLALKRRGTEDLKAARQLAPAAYAWLYRNDRTWLVQQNRRGGGARRSNHATIDWRRRDRRLAASIVRVCRGLAVRPPEVPVSLQRICGLLPHLKPMLERLDRLPRTRQVIARETAKRLRVSCR